MRLNKSTAVRRIAGRNLTVYPLALFGMGPTGIGNGQSNGCTEADPAEIQMKIEGPDYRGKASTNYLDGHTLSAGMA